MRISARWQELLLTRGSSVVEQASLSAVNFIASATVAWKAGLAELGIYTFCFVLATFLTSCFATVLQRQYMLFFSSSSHDSQRDAFKQTLALQCLGFLLLLPAVFGVIAFFASPQVLQSHRVLLVAAGGYAMLLATFELFRQLLYMRDEAVVSFKRTMTFSVLAVLLLIGMLLLPEHQVLPQTVFIILNVALLAAIVGNYYCWKEIRTAGRLEWRECWKLMCRYVINGKFALAGSTLTWLQNQGANPFFMWWGGPLIAGFFSMARMMLMPLSVINQGLVNSTAPELRRFYNQSGFDELSRRARAVSVINQLVCIVYILVLYLALRYGGLSQLIPEFNEVSPYLWLWALVVVVTVQRFWLTQKFVLCERFQLLLVVSAISVAITLVVAFMVVAMELSYHWALIAVLCAELVTMAILILRQPRNDAQLRGADSAADTPTDSGVRL